MWGHLETACAERGAHRGHQPDEHMGLLSSPPQVRSHRGGGSTVTRHEVRAPGLRVPSLPDECNFPGLHRHLQPSLPLNFPSWRSLSAPVCSHLLPLPLVLKGPRGLVPGEASRRVELCAPVEGHGGADGWDAGMVWGVGGYEGSGDGFLF